MTIELYNANCFEKLKEINEVDLIITDPPYTLKISKISKKRDICGGFYSGSNIKHLAEIKGKEQRTGFYKQLRLTDCMREVKDTIGCEFNPIEFLNITLPKSINGAFIFCSEHQLYDYINYCKENKYKWNLLFWHKTNCCPNHYNHLLRDTEFIFRIYKGSCWFDNYYNYENYRSYFCLPIEHYKNFPCPKPLLIILQILKIFSYKDYIILDPFMGSGTVGVACKTLQRNFIGVEINKEYFELAKERIEKIEKES